MSTKKKNKNPNSYVINFRNPGLLDEVKTVATTMSIRQFIEEAVQEKLKKVTKRS